MPYPIIPIVVAESLIPEGLYCYRPDPSPAATEARRAGRNYPILPCPFWSMRTDLPEQSNGYCSYLKSGDWMEDGTFLLWDQVKECGIRMDDDEEDFDWPTAAPYNLTAGAAHAPGQGLC